MGGVSVFKSKRIWMTFLGCVSLVNLSCEAPPTVREADDLSSLGQKEGMTVSLEVDTLAYMSCNQSPNTDKSAFFTFRAGAYRRGGVAVKSEFVQRMKDQRRESGDLFNIIRQSPITSSARPVISIRDSRHLQDYVDESVSPFFVSIDNTSFLHKALPSPGVPIRHLPQGIDEPVRVEASNRIPANSEASLQSKFDSNNFILALTYGDDLKGEYTHARSPYDYGFGEQEKWDHYAYGSGFKLGFAFTSAGLKRRLSSVQERDLETLLPKSKGWDCPPELVFKIVRPADMASSCGSIVADPPETFQNPASLKYIARQVLKVEDWEIKWNGISSCAVPKKLGQINSCYNADDARVNYSATTSSECTAGYEGADKDLCPHYVSVCYAKTL